MKTTRNETMLRAFYETFFFDMQTALPYDELYESDKRIIEKLLSYNLFLLRSAWLEFVRRVIFRLSWYYAKTCGYARRLKNLATVKKNGS